MANRSPTAHVNHDDESRQSVNRNLPVIFASDILSAHGLAMVFKHDPPANTCESTKEF